MSSFQCKCGKVFDDNDVPKHATGLLKSVYAQVELESYQAEKLAELFSLSISERDVWIEDHFGPDYPKDGGIEELIEDFLYKSHRVDGCTATFECPNCGRLALLEDVHKAWVFYSPDGQAK